MLSPDALTELLACSPIIAAVNDKSWDAALASPCDILFHLKANILSVHDQIRQAHAADKKLFIHLDLASGIAKDKAGIEFLAQCGADGVISTRGQLIRIAKELNLLTVQRFFLLDSQGLDSIEENLNFAAPDMIELMPGVIGKVIRRFASGSLPVIAGGLMETKAEVTEAIRCGASAISTSSQELWYS